MSPSEIHRTDEARLFLLQSLWLQRLRNPSADAIRPVLEWSFEIASSGASLLPLGILADIGELVFGDGSVAEPNKRDTARWERGLMRAYEDDVIGRLAGDPVLERSAAAVARFRGMDRSRGMAFLVGQFTECIGVEGVILNPAVVKSLLQEPPAELLAEGWHSFESHPVADVIKGIYSALVAAVRQSSSVLTAADLFELEHRTALSEFGHRIALRQVIEASTILEQRLPRTLPRRPARAQDIPTFLREEATYPVGGFSSISTRGSIESLLHSQLAYMEPASRPDLFDVKYLRDELLYYARDEGEFHRRRRTCVVAILPEIAAARVKDPGLPWQRTILFLALIVVAVRKLPGWLDRDALHFELLFVRESGHDTDTMELQLLETLMRDGIETGMVSLKWICADELQGRLDQAARRSDCRCLIAGSEGAMPKIDGDAPVATLHLDRRSPVLHAGRSQLSESDIDDPLDEWFLVLKRLLEFWG